MLIESVECSSWLSATYADTMIEVGRLRQQVAWERVPEPAGPER